MFITGICLMFIVAILTLMKHFKNPELPRKMSIPDFGHGEINGNVSGGDDTPKKEEVSLGGLI